MTEPSTDPRTPPLSEAAIGAIAALMRVSELYDPAVAHRAALRALVADRLLDHIDTSADRSVVIAAAALADVDLTVTRPAEPESTRDTTRALLADTILGRLPGMRDVATAVGARLEWWNGNGFPAGREGEQIPIGARIAAVTDVLVGDPAAGFLPSWEHARRRVNRSQGIALDPSVSRIAASIPLEDLEVPLIPSSTVVSLLQSNRAVDPASDPADPATTIKTAVAAAGHPKALLTLFAETALNTIDADEVVVLESSDTQFVIEPAARVVDESRARLAKSRLEPVFEFTTQAELRAGVSMEQSSAGTDHVDGLLAPIMIGDSCWGALVAMRSPARLPFDAHDLSVLRHVAAETAGSITKTAHWAEMERMALRDQLTGLANRHELYRVLDRIFERPPLERVDVALIMCDVDGLKVVNDTQGHQAGDRLLVDAAAAMRAAVRDPKRTTVCRIGGDEFCMVIDGGALLTAHEISDTIERLFARSAGSGDPRSISCGIAFATEDIPSRSALLRAADENQYQTKRARKASRGELLPADKPTRATVDRRAIRD